MPLCLSLPISPTCLIRGLRHRWDADARVQASLQLQLSTRGGLVLVGGKTGGGLSRDVVIIQLHVDVTRVEWDQGQREQRNLILNRHLVIKKH